MTLPDSVFPQKLRDYLTARECVAFVGAGFSMACRMPGWGALLARLLAEAKKSVTSKGDKASLRDCNNAVRAGLYPTAASGIRHLLSKEELRRHLTGAFDSARLRELSQQEQQRMLSRMENLVLGPWAGIITTNFDTLIENAFELFPQRTSPFRCHGNQDSLGNILCLPLEMGWYFVKLHGDTWADSQVLSTADYVQAWLTSPRIRHFLTAVMLRYRLVFIGCSVEDALLRLRQGLWADFGKALPNAYALLPDTPSNRLRRRELKDDAGLESLLYPLKRRGEGHEAVDMFLREARHCADLRKADTRMGAVGAVRARPLPERLEAVGAINRHLLTMIDGQPDGRLKYVHIFDPYFEQVPQDKQRHVLSTLSEGERLYRLLFLVSLQLIEEQTDGGTEYLKLSVEVRNQLASTRISEGSSL